MPAQTPNPKMQAPMRTPMFDERNELTRPWRLFFAQTFQTGEESQSVDAEGLFGANQPYSPGIEASAESLFGENISYSSATQPGDNSSLYAAASAGLVNGAAMANVVGATFTLDRDGVWDFSCVFDVTINVAASLMLGQLVIAGVIQPGNAVLGGALMHRATVPLNCRVAGVAAGQVATLQSNGTGTTTAATNTTILAEWISA